MWSSLECLICMCAACSNMSGRLGNQGQFQIECYFTLVTWKRPYSQTSWHNTLGNEFCLSFSVCLRGQRVCVFGGGGWGLRWTVLYSAVRTSCTSGCPRQHCQTGHLFFNPPCSPSSTPCCPSFSSLLLCRTHSFYFQFSPLLSAFSEAWYWWYGCWLFYFPQTMPQGELCTQSSLLCVV